MFFMFLMYFYYFTYARYNNNKQLSEQMNINIQIFMGFMCVCAFIWIWAPSNRFLCNRPLDRRSGRVSRPFFSCIR